MLKIKKKIEIEVLYHVELPVTLYNHIHLYLKIKLNRNSLSFGENWRLSCYLFWKMKYVADKQIISEKGNGHSFIETKEASDLKIWKKLWWNKQEFIFISILFMSVLIKCLYTGTIFIRKFPKSNFTDWKDGCNAALFNVSSKDILYAILCGYSKQCNWIRLLRVWMKGWLQSSKSYYLCLSFGYWHDQFFEKLTNYVNFFNSQMFRQYRRYVGMINFIPLSW